MKKTTEQELEEARLSLLLLRIELDGYINGYWKPEYHWTIGWNKKFTGNKIFMLDNSDEND